MKKFSLLLTAILMSLSMLAQTPASPTGGPQGINYQTIVRDGDGNILPYTEISLQMTIRTGAPDGEVVYAETHSSQTNGFGLVNMVIGQGIPVTGQFDQIVWSDGGFYLETGITFDGSPNYMMVGVTQLLTVPFSKYADFAGGLKSMSTEDRDALQNPQVGYAIYNITTNCLNYWNGNNWFETCGDCTPQPSQAIAGEDQYFSDETTATHLQGNQPESGTGTWNVVSGSGGTFDDANDPETLFTGQPCESYVLMWEITTPCGSTGDMVNIQFDAIPTTADAGQDILINTEELTVPLSANTPLVGNGLWTVINGDGGVFEDAGNPQTNFTGLSCESYNLRWTIATDCYESADEMNVTFDAIPSQALAGDDIIIFDSNTEVTLNAQWPETGSGLWSITSGSGGILTDPSNPATTFTAMPCETYILRWTVSTACYENYDEITVSFDDSPAMANAGADITICQNQAPILQATAQNYQTLLWETSGTGTFSNPEILKPAYLPSDDDIENGEVTLTLTAWPPTPCGNPASDHLVLTIQKFAFADAGEDATICENQTYTLEGFAENYASVLWATFGDGVFSANNILNPEYTPGLQDIANGMVTLLLTVQPLSPCNVMANDQVILVIQPSPYVFAGEDVVICENDLSVELSGNCQNCDDVQWTTNGDGFFIFPDIANATYYPGAQDRINGEVALTFSGSNQYCEPVSDQIILFILPSPVIFAGPDEEVCSGDEFFTGEASGFNFESVLWSTSGDGYFHNPLALNTTYTPGANDILNGSVILSLTALPTSPCPPVSDQMTLSFLPVPFVNAGPDQEDLPGTIATLQGNNPTGGATGLWTIASGQGGNVAQPTNPQSVFTGQPGETYLLQWSITAQNGCVNSDFVIISFQVPDGSPCPGTPTVTDVDGNVYNTVLIGNQCWMKENLKTTKYRNGTPIVYPGTNNSAWQNNTTGAYAWHNNDIGWKDSYGALYNWHAVNNANDLCPTGWHVPSDAEWTQLVDYVVAQGFPNDWNNPNGAGNALKSCRQINSPLGGSCNTTVHPRWEQDTWSGDNHHGFDEFGFSGLPGGYRDTGGSFSYVGFNGYWWSSTDSNPIIAWYRTLVYYDGNVSRNYNDKSYGFSVRCLRD